MPELHRPADQIVVHFYRAVVAHADAWRQRMDATTNWAAATTAAMISVSFSGAAPHFVLLLALGFDTMFLLMESRRYQVYDIWRRRVHWLNRYYIVPALSARYAPAPEVAQNALDELARDLGRTVPFVCLHDAVGFRIQRNYGYLFAVAILAWLLKLGVHPRNVGSLDEFVQRATVGPLPGAAMLAIVVLFAATMAALAVQAPSERMIEWTETPSRWQRWRERRRRERTDTAHGGDLPPAPIDG